MKRKGVQTINESREANLARIASQQSAELQFLQESISVLQVQLENLGWERLGAGDKWDFTPENLERLRGASRLLAIKNPLIKRSVSVQVYYVWALGVTIAGVHPVIDEVIQDFLNDPKNKCEIGDKSAREELDRNQQIFGNTYFMFFIDKTFGTVRLRAMDVDEIKDIYRNPDDYKENWFYKRVVTDDDGATHTTWYPDWEYLPTTQGVPEALVKRTNGQFTVDWEHPVCHIKTGHVGSMKFGIPEHYAAFDYATAYKEFLENWCSIMRAYARMSMQLTAKTSKGAAAAKSKLDTSASTLTNVAGFAASTSGIELKAIKTAGATTSADEGYAIKMMVAAAADLPGTFYGDADVGNFATSETLDRPTELKMVSRQNFWADFFRKLFDFVINWATIAPQGKLRTAGAKVEEILDAKGQQYVYRVTLPKETNKALGEVGKPISREIAITFPDILERSVADSVRAVIGAVTLNGNQPTDILRDPRVVAEVLLKLIYPKTWKGILDKVYPPGEKVDPIPPPMSGGNGNGQGNPNDPTQTGRTAPANTPKGKKQNAK